MSPIVFPSEITPGLSLLLAPEENMPPFLSLLDAIAAAFAASSPTAIPVGEGTAGSEGSAEESSSPPNTDLQEQKAADRQALSPEPFFLPQMGMWMIAAQDVTPAPQAADIQDSGEPGDPGIQASPPANPSTSPPLLASAPPVTAPVPSEADAAPLNNIHPSSPPDTGARMRDRDPPEATIRFPFPLGEGQGAGDTESGEEAPPPSPEPSPTGRGSPTLAPMPLQGEGMSQTPFNGNDQDSPLAGEPEDTGGRAGRKAPASSAPPTGYADALAKPPPASAGPKGFAHELAPSSSGHVPDPLPLITQLTDRMYVAIKDGQQELRVVLTPENLGTVRVEIATNEGDMTARLLVDNPLVKDLVEGNLNRLKDALLAQGLQLQDIAVSVSHHFMQRESSGRNLPFGEPGWKAQQRHTPDGPAREIPGTSNGARSSPDSLLVDLFV